MLKRSPFKKKEYKPLKRSPLRKVSLKPKVKKRKVKNLKKELDAVFSQYIRRKYANENGEVKCYTCSIRRAWKEMQNGHFVSRSHLSTRFDESNCRPQCVGCNVFGGGKVVVFGTNLQAELGEAIITRLYNQAQQIVKNYPYQEKIEEYKTKLALYEKTELDM